MSQAQRVPEFVFDDVDGLIAEIARLDTDGGRLGGRLGDVGRTADVCAIVGEATDRHRLGPHDFDVGIGGVRA